MIRKYYLPIAFLVAGAILGFLIFHPYAMLMYSFTNMPGHENQEAPAQGKDLIDALRTTFAPTMLPMAVSFVFLNSIIGLLVGVLIGRKRRLEQQKISLETLNRLMITLSHYLLNANAVIGGIARRCKRTESKNDILRSLDVIEEQARKIDAVIKALKELTEIKTADYTTNGKALMIDITKEMDSLLNATQRKETGSSNLPQNS